MYLQHLVADSHGGEKRLYCQLQNVFRTKNPVLLQEINLALVDHFATKIDVKSSVCLSA